MLSMPSFALRRRPRSGRVEMDTCPLIGNIHSYDPEARMNLKKNP